ncbi:hypothetical protein K439DRAFT_1617205 [Ramaria rubella]|nr:hypothetical protein K439DRAFT_1617205 [Ramaria rubella]
MSGTFSNDFTAMADSASTVSKPPHRYELYRGFRYEQGLGELQVAPLSGVYFDSADPNSSDTCAAKTTDDAQLYGNKLSEITPVGCTMYGACGIDSKRGVVWGRLMEFVFGQQADVSSGHVTIAEAVLEVSAKFRDSGNVAGFTATAVIVNGGFGMCLLVFLVAFSFYVTVTFIFRRFPPLRSLVSTTSTFLPTIFNEMAAQVTVRTF